MYIEYNQPRHRRLIWVDKSSLERPDVSWLTYRVGYVLELTFVDGVQFDVGPVTMDGGRFIRRDRSMRSLSLDGKTLTPPPPTLGDSLMFDLMIARWLKIYGQLITGPAYSGKGPKPSRKRYFTLRQP